MELAQLLNDNWSLIAALVMGGLLMGFIAGLLGIGGGAMLVAILYEVFQRIGVPEALCLHLSIGTSLLVMVPTSLRSFLAHKKRKSVDLRVLKTLMVPIIIGVLVGIMVAKYSNPYAIKIVWVSCLSVLALKMIFARNHWRLGDDVPHGFGMRLYGVFVGCMSTIMSIGGGAFTSSMMTLYGRTIHQAVGTSAGVGPLIAIPGALGFMWAGYGLEGLPTGSIGYVSLIGAAIVIPASVLLAPWGARLAHGITKRQLELTFAFFMCLISFRFAFSL